MLERVKLICLKIRCLPCLQMPGTIMAMGRLNRPSIMIYGGTIKVSNYPFGQLTVTVCCKALCLFSCFLLSFLSVRISTQFVVLQPGHYQGNSFDIVSAFQVSVS
jgi:Dehydratase family